MKKLCVNSVKCIGCGACVGLDPEHFDFSDAGLSEAISQENLESVDLQNAVEGCHTAAIELEEVVEAGEPTNNVVEFPTQNTEETEEKAA